MLRDCFEPDEKFLKECREIFLSKIDERFGRQPKPMYFPVWQRAAFKYGIVSLCGVFLMGSGAAVYADKQNVSYSHPLYPLKRISETVKLTLAPAQSVPALHNEFANRRLEEIKTIGEKFDPNLHEAVGEIESKDKESGIIVEEIQKGYKTDGRLLRPAKVKVVR